MMSHRNHGQHHSHQTFSHSRSLTNYRSGNNLYCVIIEQVTSVENDGE